MRAARVAVVAVLLALLCLTVVGLPRLGLNRPSIAIFVLDTLRADAVSAYGHTAGTTPNFDAIAAQGLLYTRAYAQAPWTLPSHATLFTGMLPAEHGAGVRGWRLADSYETMAERLNDYGYETAGFSENHFVSGLSNLDQGFETFRMIDSTDRNAIVRAVREWLAGRNSEQPFFVFVNLMDAHSPYEVRAQNPFVPAGVSVEKLHVITQSLAPEPLCNQPLTDEQLAALRGLYLGDVSAADATLGAIWNLLRDVSAERLITVVTSDHGEHLGEHGLMGHLFSLWNELLHVPLAVHGLDGVTPRGIDDPVQLVDLFSTVLRWASSPAGRPMPGLPVFMEEDDAAAQRSFVAQFVDFANVPDDGSALARRTKDLARKVRRGCSRADRVYGDMRSVIRYPLKLLEIDGDVAGLYDLDVDSTESDDLAVAHPVQVTELLSLLPAAVAPVDGLPVARKVPVALAPDVAERLRVLGYLE